MASAGPQSRWLAVSLALSALAAACMALMWLSPSAASADEAEWMYNPNQVVQINLTLPEPGVKELEEEPDEYPEQKGTFQLIKVGGEAVPPSPLKVSIKLKGHTSFRPLSRKAAFKLKFGKSPNLFFGVKKITLNNMVEDPSMVHETLAYEMFRTLGVPASRTGYADVHLNGINYGVYLNLESLDDPASFTRMFGPENTWHLYEADTAGVDVRPGEAGTFEIQEEIPEKEPPVISDLEKLIEVVNNHSGDWSDNMATVADLPEMVQMWSVERYIGNWDGYAGQSNGDITPNNYYLHSTPAGIFAMLPWGTDESWAPEPTLNRKLTFGEPAGGRMFDYCYEDASCKGQYVNDLGTIYAGVPAMNLEAHAVALASMLAPYQAEEEAGRREFSAAQIANGLTETRQFIADRQKELAEYLWPPKPTPPSPPERPKFGATKIHGAVVITNLTAFGAGSAVQKVTTRLEKGHLAKGCTGTREVHRARELTVQCRLSHRVWRLAKSRRLRLNVKVGFTYSAGGSTFRVHHLTLERRP